MKFIRVIGTVGKEKHIYFINTAYITDIKKYIYLGVSHISIGVQSAHGGAGGGGVRINLMGDELINFMKEMGLK